MGQLDSAYLSVAFLMCGLVCGMSIYVARSESNVFASDDLLQEWYKVFRWLMRAGYFCYFMGLIYLFLGISYAVLLNYPW